MAEPPRIPRQRLKHAGAGWVRRYAEWSHFCHFTFDRPVHPAVADKALLQYRRTVAKLIGEHFAIVWAEELQDRGVVHFHVLLALPKSRLTCAGLDELWKTQHREANFARVTVYDPAKNAAGYLCKEGAFVPEVVCPRTRACRRTGRGCMKGSARV